LPVITGVYRASFIWESSQFPGNAVNVMHFQGLGTTHTPSDLVTALNASVTSTMWFPIGAATITTLNIIALDGTSATETHPTSGGVKWSGGQSGDMTAQVAAIIKLQTGLRGRNRRGRVYLPWLSEVAVSHGSLVSGMTDTVTPAWTTFQEAMQTGAPPNFVLGVASYDRAHNGAAPAFHPATNLVCESLTATQRRRQPGRKVSRH
jgi:hypothetical protein